MPTGRRSVEPLSAMMIDPQRLVGSEFGVHLAAWVGGAIPARTGYRLAEFVADRIASRRNSKIVRAVRANQWVAQGETLQGEALEEAVRDTLRNTAHSVFELYHGLRHFREARDSIVIDSTAQFILTRPPLAERGLMLVSIHLGNFDHILHTLSKQGIQPLLLTIQNPRGGRRVEFDSREKAGAHLLPSGFTAFRQAMRHLKLGGMAATGIDRPIPNPRLRPRFFGRPAALPLHHVFLAARADVPVIVLATIRRADGKNVVLASEPLEMEKHPDRETEAVLNAERLLRIAEGYIRKAPTQWSVSLPVWPEILKPNSHS